MRNSQARGFSGPLPPRCRRAPGRTPPAPGHGHARCPTPCGAGSGRGPRTCCGIRRPSPSRSAAHLRRSTRIAVRGHGVAGPCCYTATARPAPAPAGHRVPGTPAPGDAAPARPACGHRPPPPGCWRAGRRRARDPARAAPAPAPAVPAPARSTRPSTARWRRRAACRAPRRARCRRAARSACRRPCGYRRHGGRPLRGPAAPPPCAARRPWPPVSRPPARGGIPPPAALPLRRPAAPPSPGRTRARCHRERRLLHQVRRVLAQQPVPQCGSAQLFHQYVHLRLRRTVRPRRANASGPGRRASVPPTGGRCTRCPPAAQGTRRAWRTAPPRHSCGRSPRWSPLPLPR
jgi:hypothetical protein